MEEMLEDFLHKEQLDDENNAPENNKILIIREIMYNIYHEKYYISEEGDEVDNSSKKHHNYLSANERCMNKFQCPVNMGMEFRDTSYCYDDKPLQLIE